MKFLKDHTMRTQRFTTTLNAIVWLKVQLPREIHRHLLQCRFQFAIVHDTSKVISMRITTVGVSVLRVSTRMRKVFVKL